MKALIYKEVRELALPFVVGFALFCVAWFQAPSSRELLGVPDQSWYVVTLIICAVLGAILGWVQFTNERWRGTHRFLVHRGTERRGAFAAKAIVGATAVYSLAVLPLVLRALELALTAPSGTELHLANLRLIALAGLFAAPCYAAGALAGALRRSTLETGLLALVGSAGLTLGASLMGLWSAPWLLARIVIVLALLAAAAVALAWQIYRIDDDGEFAAAPNWHAFAALVSLVLIVMPLTFGAFLPRESLRSDALSNTHLVQSRATGELFPIAPLPGGGFARADGRELGGGEELHARWANELARPEFGWGPELDLVPIFDSRWVEPRSAPLAAPFDGSSVEPWPFEHWRRVAQFELPSNTQRRDAYLDSRAGVLRVFTTATNGAELMSAGASGGAFSESAVERPAGERFHQRCLVPNYFTSSSGIVADLEDHTIWRLDLSKAVAQLERIELPNGDRWVGVEELYDAEKAEFGWYVPAPQATVLWIGEHGRYVVARDAFVDFDALPLEQSNLAARTAPLNYLKRPVIAAQIPALQRWKIAAVDSDPFEPRFELRDAKSGAVLTSWGAEPATVRQTWSRRLILATRIAATPIGLLGSFTSDAPREYSALVQSSPFGDPLFAGGRRGWLVGGVVLFALGAAAMVFFALRARGASRLATFAWTALVAACGLPGLLAFLTFEPRGVRRRATSTRAQATEALTPALIRTAS